MGRCASLFGGGRTRAGFKTVLLTHLFFRFSGFYY